MSVSALDVLIVGAGPVGLALACHCRRLGLAVRVVDLKAGPSTTSKAIGLQYRVSEVLALMGVVDRFLERGATAATVNMYRGDRRLVQLHFRGFSDVAGRDAFAPTAIMLPQSETEKLLIDLLGERGGAVEWNTNFERYQEDGDRVVSYLRRPDGSEEAVASAWLVSCEGAHSLIRKQAGLSFQGETYPQTFYMADVELDWQRSHDEHHVWFHPEGSFAALALPGHNKFRLLIEVAPEAELKVPLTLDVVRDLMARRMGDRVPGIGNATWLSEFRINCRMVDAYRRGRVLLAGDAAHIHSPTGGQGIVTGVQDATNLAWKLARVQAGAPQELLDTYEEERLPAARSVLKETSKTTALFTGTGLVGFLRDWVVLPVLNLRWVQRRMFFRLAQLHVGYRGCRLSRHEDARWFGGTRVRAGDRAPDVAFRRATGEIVTLFRLLEPLQPVALVGTEAGTDAGLVERLLSFLAGCSVEAYLVGPGPVHPRRLEDAYGDFRRLYGMTGEFLCLIRPDDHIGLFQRPVREEGLRAYLAQLSAPGRS